MLFGMHVVGQHISSHLEVPSLAISPGFVGQTRVSMFISPAPRLLGTQLECVQL